MSHNAIGSLIGAFLAIVGLVAFATHGLRTSARKQKAIDDYYNPPGTSAGTGTT